MKRWHLNIIWKTDFRTHQCDKICDITLYMSPSLVQESDLLGWSWSRSWSFLFKWSFGYNDLDHLSDLDLWSRSLFKWSSRTLIWIVPVIVSSQNPNRYYLVLALYVLRNPIKFIRHSMPAGFMFHCLITPLCLSLSTQLKILLISASICWSGTHGLANHGFSMK